MTHRFLLLSFGILVSYSIFAQQTDRIYPAHSEGKMLTMNEVTVSGVTRPQSFPTQWLDNSHFLFREGKTTRKASIKGEIEDYTPEPGGITPPEDADNTFSNGHNLIAYTVKGSLYCQYGDEDKVLVAQAQDNDIVYGESVSRNEFGIDRGIFWSPDGRLLAFYRKDQSGVSEFPLLDIKTRTGSLNSIKYPMNGMDSERISLGVYDSGSRKTVYLNVSDFDEQRYLTNISWSPDSRYIFIQVLDRSQHHMHLNMYKSCDGSFVRTLLTEDNDAWIEPYEQLHFIKGSWEFIYSTDNRDGFKNLYLCDTLGNVRRLVNTDAELNYIADDGRYIFYASAQCSPVESHLFRLELNKNKIGKPQRLTAAEGWHNISMSEDCKYFIDHYSSYTVPGVTELRKADGTLVRELFRAPDPLAGYHTGEVRFGTVKSADGQYDNYYRLFLPKDFDPAKKYPLVLYVYGGPHSQMVTNSWMGSVRMWEMLMAQKGYIVYVQDNRGTEHRGAAYEKAINRQCGKVEMDDQMVGINWLRSLPYVDKDRIAVHGWSYGGFMTISLMTTYPDIFKTAVAGGPVIDWKWYEIMYGERYMDTPETNPEGFEETSLVNKASNLKGKLLICQGAIDNTVVWQHSLNFVQKCIEENIQLDYFPYPLSEHNVAGAWREHLMQKVTDYIDDNL